MFNPFPFIFVILELKIFLTVAQKGHGAKQKLLKKWCTLGTMLHIRGLQIGCNRCITSFMIIKNSEVEDIYFKPLTKILVN